MKYQHSILSILLSLGFASMALAADVQTNVKTDQGATASPWAFNLSAYMWLAGATGNFSAGPYSRSVDTSFIDINSQSRRFPLGFMGRAEATYDRFGFYLDGNYMDLQLKPKLNSLSNGLDSTLGLMDYGFMYRVFGPSASELLGLQNQKRPNRLDVYAGARTLWLDNSVDLATPRGLVERGVSRSQTFTSPIIGSRIVVDFTPQVFMLVDGNVGGFGAQSVTFTGGILGLVGYRMSDFGLPLSIEAGYKALRYNLDRGGPIQTNATLNGPFLGLTGYW